MKTTRVLTSGGSFGRRFDELFLTDSLCESWTCRTEIFSFVATRQLFGKSRHDFSLTWLFGENRTKVSRIFSSDSNVSQSVDFFLLIDKSVFLTMISLLGFLSLLIRLPGKQRIDIYSNVENDEISFSLLVCFLSTSVEYDRSPEMVLFSAFPSDAQKFHFHSIEDWQRPNHLNNRQEGDQSIEKTRVFLLKARRTNQFDIWWD